MIRINPVYNRLFFLTISILIFILLGAFGLMLSDDLCFLDAIWYSTMTLTTVGYGVPDAFSDAGKIITIFLMLFGVGAVLYGLTALALEFFSGAIIENFKQKNLHKKVNHLQNHIIICGFGRNGRQAARKLILHNKPFVVIDKQPLENRDDEFGKTIFIAGNAIDDDVLQKAGIDHAGGLIAALPSDADNLFIVITAKQLNSNIKIISRASNSNTISKLKTAGASNVIMPDRIGGEHMASLLVTPDLVEFMDHISLEGSEELNLIEMPFSNINSEYIGKKIGDLQITEQTKCSIIGYKNANGTYTINPCVDTEIEANATLIVLGQPQQIKQVLRLFTCNV